MSKHLSYHQRVQIETLFKQGASRATIAAFVGRSTRTIFYELKRGEYQRRDGDTWEMLTSYSADIAQARYNDLKRQKGRDLKLASNWAFVEYVERKIGKEKYSPKAVLGEIQQQQLDFGFTVSHTTLYDWIYKGYFLHLTCKQLPEGKRKKKHKKVVARKASYRHPLDLSIEQRPDVIAERLELGHWEMDTVQGVRTGKQPCLLVLTEKKSNLEIVMKMHSKTADETVRCLDALQRKYKAQFRAIFKSITCDNGCEFADSEGITKGDRTKLYYCHSFCSWERGQNENANKLIRRHVPKGVSIKNFSKKYVKYVESWMNNYPRQMLGWKTPQQCFDALLTA